MADGWPFWSPTHRTKTRTSDGWGTQFHPLRAGDQSMRGVPLRSVMPVMPKTTMIPMARAK